MFNWLKRNNLQFVDPDRENRLAAMEQKRKQAIAELGDKYILHPKHKVTKLTNPRSF